MQNQLLDIHFSFFCRSTVIAKDGLHPIVLRIIYRGARKDIFTGLKCTSINWDNNTQRIVGRDKAAIATNKQLDYLLHQCRELFDKLKYSGQPFTTTQFVQILKGKDKSLTTIVEYLNEKVSELKGRLNIDITQATVHKYSRCINLIKEFCKKKYKTDDISITTINESLLMEFFYYLRTEKNHSHNTSVNYLKCLKTVLLPAVKKGIISNDPFVSLKIRAQQVNRGFLTIQEIRQLEQLTTLTTGVEQVRDIFLFACYTGMAYIDIKQFANKHIIKDTDGTISVYKPRQKTGQLSIIPLLQPAIRLLEKYSPTRDILDFRWNVITNQKVNEHLKTIQKEANIQQELYFHLARHTFATTITLTNGVPLETVSRMLGHTNIKMTQRYAKISGYKIKEDMKRISEMFA